MQKSRCYVKEQDLDGLNVVLMNCQTTQEGKEGFAKTLFSRTADFGWEYCWTVHFLKEAEFEGESFTHI